MLAIFKGAKEPLAYSPRHTGVFADSIAEEGAGYLANPTSGLSPSDEQSIQAAT